MNYSIKSLARSEIEIDVTIPFSEFEPQVKRAAVLISEEHEVEGFRRGKAPYDIVKSKFGEHAIYERAAEIAVRASYPEAMTGIRNKESGIRDGDFTPIGKPEITITKLAPGNELQYKVKLAVLPAVVLPDWREIAKRVRGNEKSDVSVSEKEVDDTIQWIRDSRSPLVTVDRPAQKGDRVEVDFEVRQGGVKVAEGDSRNHPLILGKGKFITGFEENLEGMKSGEKKEFTLITPQDWRQKELSGKPLDFSVTMKLIQEKQEPQLNEDFAKGFGNFGSLADLQKSVREGIGAEKREKEKQRVRALMIETIAKDAKMEIPEVLVSRELDKMIEELKSGVEGMSMKWEDYLLHIKKNTEELKIDWRNDAENRVRIALCLREIAKEAKAEVNEQEIEAHLNQYLQQYKTVEEAKAVDHAAFREYSRGVVRNEKVFKLLEDI